MNAPWAARSILVDEFGEDIVKYIEELIEAQVTAPRCQCGHADINHSDISLEALGSCYHCKCQEFVKP